VIPVLECWHRIGQGAERVAASGITGRRGGDSKVPGSPGRRLVSSHSAPWEAAATAEATAASPSHAVAGDCGSALAGIGRGHGVAQAVQLADNDCIDGAHPGERLAERLLVALELIDAVFVDVIAQKCLFTDRGEHHIECLAREYQGHIADHAVVGHKLPVGLLEHGA
jgi:hypothetical protein